MSANTVLWGSHLDCRKIENEQKTFMDFRMNLEKLLRIVIFLLIVGFASAKLSRQLPLVINTWEFTSANAAAWRVLNQSSNSALDALVEGCSTCERLQCDGTVGFGGSPDENGETTLDALVIDGSNINMGAVAGLKQVKDAIRLARYVLEHTDHTMLVGDAASDFAEMLGFKRESLTTSKSKAIWQKWRDGNCQPNFWRNVYPDPRQSCGPYHPVSEKTGKCERTTHSFGKYNHDTIGMIVIDGEGHIYAGTSTNGARHKIPGRVGDSPIPGAGAYADNSVGAAVATGDGDIMMRFLPSFLAIEQLRSGKSTEEAAQFAMERIVRYHSTFTGALIVVDRYGNYSASCVGMKRFPFSIAGGILGGRTRVEYKNCLSIAFL